MALVSVEGRHVHYRLDGPPDANVLLLSHSLGNDLRMWDSQVEAFSRFWRVLRYDSRGHGESPATPGPYSIEQLGRDVVMLLDELQIERVHFCGLSLGGMVGMWLAVNAPARIERLILSNTAPKLGPPSRWDERIRAVEAEGMAAVAEMSAQRWFTPAFRRSCPAVVERIVDGLLHTPVAGYVASCAAIRDMDQTEVIGAIAHQTLVIVGAEDAAIPPADGALIAQKIARATLVSLPAAHLSNVEADGPFNDAVVSFLS